MIFLAEVKLFDELLKDLVKTIPEPEQTMGRPRIPLHESLFCAIQKVYSQLSSRRAHGLFQSTRPTYYWYAPSAYRITTTVAPRPRGNR